MSLQKPEVYTAPGHNATERAEMMSRLKKKLYPILAMIIFMTIGSIIFYFYAVPGLNASGQHYYYHGTDEGPVGTYMGNLMMMTVPLMWLMVFLAYSVQTMNLPPKTDYASKNSGLGEVQIDDEWNQMLAKTQKMIAENFYTIIMRVPKASRFRTPSEKVYGGFDLFMNLGPHAYLLRRLRWEELTEDQQKQIKDAEARDRRNNRMAMAGGFGAGIIIGSGGSVH